MRLGTTLLNAVVRVLLPPVVVLPLVQAPLCLALLYCGIMSFLAMTHHSQSATWSNSLFSLNHLQVRFEWFNHGRVPIVLFLLSDHRGQS